MEQQIHLKQEEFTFSESGGETFLTDIEHLDWGKAKYFVYTIKTQSDRVIPLTLRFYNTKGEYIQATIGTIPQIEVVVAFPLSALDAQRVFLPRTPGKLKTVISGTKLDKNDITRVSFGTCANYESQSFALKKIALTTEEPQYRLSKKKLVDQLGQMKIKDWPEKTKNEQELVTYLHSLLHQKPTYPTDWSPYGGWKKKSFKATGFFRTEHDGRRWWFVDPDGYAFWSAGLDCINLGESGLLSQIEELYDWLPEKSGVFQDMYTTDKNSCLYVNYAVGNLIRSFGKNYKDSWVEITAQRMKEWRFNTVGNWSSLEFIKKAKMPYVWPLRDFPCTEKTIFRDFPDVFSKEYADKSRIFARQLEAFKNDPYMIGYFITNEPQWAFAGDVNLAEELLEKEESLESKRVFVKQMEDKYVGDIKKFNEAWHVKFNRFNDLLEPIKKPSQLSVLAKLDLEDFTKELVYQYTKLVCNAVKEVDEHHLNLGMRYAWVSSENIYEGSKLFDVFTLNSYSMVPKAEQIMEVSEKSGLPVMIGEFHFGAPDVGLPSTGLRSVTNQGERAKAYRYYIENGASIPALIGAHYFTLNDQAALGRFDGENFQIGIVDVCHKPYRGFVNGIIAAHQNLYSVADGQMAPYSAKAKEIPRIGF